MDQAHYPEYEGKYEGYDAPPNYSQQQQMSNVAAQPSAHVVTSQPGVATTTVVVNMPTVVSGPFNVNPGTRTWSSGTCSCFNDIGSCLCVAFCGPCAACEINSRLGENCCTLCCVPGAMISLRTKLRLLAGIQGSICDDCLMVACCGHCTMCQMMREMDTVGIQKGGCC